MAVFKGVKCVKDHIVYIQKPYISGRVLSYPAFDII